MKKKMCPACRALQSQLPPDETFLAALVIVAACGDDGAERVAKDLCDRHNDACVKLGQIALRSVNKLTAREQAS